jgi:hypothetical protein
LLNGTRDATRSRAAWRFGFLERDPEPDIWSLAMELYAGPPHQWIVTLRSGPEVELAADRYNEQDGYAIFNVGVSATPDEQAAARVTGRAPVGPRILMMVAKSQ